MNPYIGKLIIALIFPTVLVAIIQKELINYNITQPWEAITCIAVWIFVFIAALRSDIF